MAEVKPTSETGNGGEWGMETKTIHGLWQPEPESEYEGSPEPEVEPEANGEAEVEPETSAEAEAEGDITSDPEGSAEFTSLNETVLWICLYGIFIVLILAGNVLIIGILLKNKQAKRSATNLFILSLLLARACIAIFVVPARITGIFSEEYLGSVMCKLCHFAELGSSVSSVLSTMGVALAKYLEVVRKTSESNMRQTVWCITAVWVFSYLYATRKVPLTDLTEVELPLGKTIISCTLDPDHTETSNAFIFVDFVVLFLTPFVVIMFCYLKVINAFRLSQQDHDKLSREQPRDIDVAARSSLGETAEVRARPRQNGQSAGPSYRNGSQGETCQTGKQPKPLSREFLHNAQMLVTITLLFTICTSVPYIWRLYIFWTDELPATYQDIDRAVYLCSYANPWINVFVFMYFRNDIRSGVKKLCYCFGRYKRREKVAVELQGTELSPCA